MAPITNLYAQYYYPYRRTNLPVVVLMHGWGSDAITGIGYTVAKRIALRGFFVIVPGMRGRNGADGSRDASGREIYDIYDGVAHARATYPTLASAEKAAIVGYSGGGGNALAAACKFPDFWNVVVSHFGMSDYGRDGTDGWYQNNNGDYTAQIATSVGNTPAVVPNNYYARDATAAIKNFSGGYLYLYHDQADVLVPFVHSTRIKAAMDAAGLANYIYSVTNVGDSPRWTHAAPELVQDLAVAEVDWSTRINSQAAWTVPTAGTVTVIGYIVTKRFTIWLNSGLDAAATVVYDTTAGTYTVTPLTSADITVAITQGALAASGTATAGGPTVFTVA